MNKAQVTARLDQVEADVIDRLMTLAAEYDGEDAGAAGRTARTATSSRAWRARPDCRPGHPTAPRRRQVMRDAERIAAIAEYERAEAEVIDRLMARAASYDGKDAAQSVADLARRLEMSSVTRNQLAMMLAAVTIRLHRTGKET